MNRIAIVVGSGLAASSLLLHALAGPIDPPAGPVGSTAKPLSEVEPRIAISATNTPGDGDSLFKITAPGSYYLTGNITGVANKHGIEIASSGVTLNLNGFDLVGIAGMGPFDGISTTQSNLTDIAVVNGSVRNWGDEGVDIGLFAANGCRVEGVRASGNAGAGIRSGRASSVSNCSSYNNAAGGIWVGNGSTIINCSAYNNPSTGINADSGCTILNCSAYQNASGISASLGNTVSNCTAYQNTGTGITLNAGCVLSQCAAYLNGTEGVVAVQGCTLSDCSVYDNSANGISTGAGCTIADCTVMNNTLDGIVCSSSCVIRGNQCSANGNGAGDGANIHTTSGDNRIEGNNCTGADRGIDVDSSGSIIVRNTCANNAINWAIAIGNSHGPIVVAGVNTIAISGNSGVASTLTSTDPNANFSY